MFDHVERRKFFSSFSPYENKKLTHILLEKGEQIKLIIFRDKFFWHF